MLRDANKPIMLGVVFSNVVMLSVIMLSDIILSLYAEWHYVQCRGALKMILSGIKKLTLAATWPKKNWNLMWKTSELLEHKSWAPETVGK